MVKFGEYLKDVSVEKYREKYVDYDRLKECLDLLKNGVLNGCNDFYKKLEASYMNSRIYAETWLLNLEDRTKFMPDVFKSGLDLQTFVSLNEEALRKIM